MQRLALSTTLVLALGGPASAQTVYDAGTPGNPATAPSPVTQGWTESITGTVTVGDVSPDPAAPFNAWQITDVDAGEGTYEVGLGGIADGWEASVTMRMLGGSVFLFLDTGDIVTDSVYDVEFETVGNDVLVHRPDGPPLFCAGGANSEYHTYRFLIVGSYPMLFWYDDAVLGYVGETAWGMTVFGAGVRFGTGDGAGRARFHRVYVGPAASHYLSNGGACFGNPGVLAVVGSEVVADDDLTLVASQLPTDPNIGYFIMGTGSNTFTPPGSAGAICVSPGILRFLPPVQNTSQLEGGFWRSVGTSGTVSGAITAGSRWGFQAWHRDGMNPSNLTQAVFVNFQ